MARKLTTASRPFTVLVANLSQGSDPSLGPAGNPSVTRSTFTTQRFHDIRGRGPETAGRQRNNARRGYVDYTTSPIPVGANGTITVASATFTGPTSIQLGQYTLVSGYDYTVGATAAATATATVVATPSTATLTIGGQALTDAAGARTPGNNDYDGTLGTEALIAADIVDAINDALNGFAAIATAVDAGGGAITLTAVPV